MGEITAMPEAAKLGQKIRQARLMRRLTLRDLAMKADCSASLLSKIEHNKAVPSLRMLHRIVGGLESSISDLFSERTEDEVTIYRAGERQTVQLDVGQVGGGITLERLAPFDEDQTLDGNIHVAAPGASNGGAIRHVGQELGYVIQGHVELVVSDKRHVLGPGDSFFFGSELPHSYRNIGKETLKILWVNTPPTF